MAGDWKNMISTISAARNTSLYANYELIYTESSEDEGEKDRKSAKKAEDSSVMKIFQKSTAVEQKSIDLNWLMTSTMSIEARAKRFIHVYGMLYTTSENEIRKLFSGFNIRSIHMHDHNGLFRGVAYIEFSNPGEAVIALKKHGTSCGKRFISTTSVCDRDLSEVLKHAGAISNDCLGFLRVAGFGDRVSKDFLSNYFGFQNSVIDIMFSKHPDPDLCEYFLVLSKWDVEQAMKKDNEKLEGKKHVTVYRITSLAFREARKCIEKQLPTVSFLIHSQKGRKVKQQIRGYWPHLLGLHMDQDNSSNSKSSHHDSPNMAVFRIQQAKGQIERFKNSHVQNWSHDTLVKSMKETLMNMQNLVSKSDFMMQENINNGLEYVKLIDRKFQSDMKLLKNQMDQTQKMMDRMNEAAKSFKVQYDAFQAVMVQPQSKTI